MDKETEKIYKSINRESYELFISKADEILNFLDDKHTAKETILKYGDKFIPLANSVDIPYQFEEAISLRNELLKENKSIKEIANSDAENSMKLFKDFAREIYLAMEIIISI